MPKQVVFVENGKVIVRMVTDQVFANMAESQSSETDFKIMLEELQKIVNDKSYRVDHAAKFLDNYGSWLFNLAKTGFAIDNGQFLSK